MVEQPEQPVTLDPGESELVSFDAIPHEVRTYQVKVDGLTGSFRAMAPPEPSALLKEYQKVLGEAHTMVEDGYPDMFVYIPGYGLQYAYAAIPQLEGLMTDEAISIGMITSAADRYFVRDVMYFSDGTTIVPYWWTCPYCPERFRSPALLDAHLEAVHWEIINTRATITDFNPEMECIDPPFCDYWDVIGTIVTWRNDSPFPVQGHVRVTSSRGGPGGPPATANQDTILAPGESVTVYFGPVFGYKIDAILTLVDGAWPGLLLDIETTDILA